MKKRLPTILLASLIEAAAAYSPPALADITTDHCLLGVPVYTKPLVHGDSNTLPVHIQADHTATNNPEYVLFRGNVDIEQGNSTLSADEVQLKQQHQEQNRAMVRTVKATGHVNYASNEIKLQGSKAWSNLNTKDTNIYNGHYQLVGRQGRGAADTIKQRGHNRYTVLENGSFTSCLPGDDSWSVVGSELIYDREQQVAEIWHARFKIGQVPIFYSPYLHMPVGDKRRSGFLILNTKYGSHNGVAFSVPYYINLAPNYDATITPNYMSKRDPQIQTEFRYLTPFGGGLVAFDWLPKDRVYSSEHASDVNDSTRWLLYWRHHGILDQVWRFNVDYTQVSDSNYFDDLDSKYGNTSNGYAIQKFSVGYVNDHWDTTLSYKHFQVLDNNDSHAYRAAPQLDLTYYKNNIGPCNFNIFSQVANFTHINNEYPEATRWHIEPTLKLLLANHWGVLNTEAKLIATHYQQKNIDAYNVKKNTYRHLKRSVNRILPQFKTDVKMVFERDMDCALDYTQTLEPHLQYLYIPYCNQNSIGLYDSTIMQIDYSGLFRDRTYSGLDRISSANQLTGGVITRIYNAKYVEQFSASIGQMFYFSRPRVSDSTGILNHDNIGSVVWAGHGYWRISDQWVGRGSMLYMPRLHSITLGNLVLEYRRNDNCILQLNYRYASPQYIEHMLSSNMCHPGYKQGIAQLGSTGILPLVNSWSLIGAYYYDAKANQSAVRLIGLQYNTCCWSMNVSYERKITSWNNTYGASQYDNKVSFNIELRGLSSRNDSLGTDNMLGSGGILPYQRVF